MERPEEKSPTSGQNFLRRPSTGISGTVHSGLPTVLTELVPQRLRFAALSYAVIFSMNIAEFWIRLSIGRAPRAPGMRDYAALASILAAFVVFFLSAKGRLGTRALGYLSLGFLITGSFGIALASIDPHFPSHPISVYLGIPWTCVWVALFPVTVPTRPLHALVGGIGATVATHLALLVNVHVAPDVHSVPSAIWWGMTLSMVLCFGWGALLAKNVYHLGQEVSRERRRGSYHLEELLGQGGMGEVWFARHQMLARPAAVKLIRREVLSGGEEDTVTVRRFEREAQATAGLQSPHSVSLYDFGVSRDGTFYYVMEYLRGIDLQTIVERHGPVDASRAIHWLRHACHSLAEAHAQGLIHRDIKPANLYACHFGLEADFVKILDFGLVKRTASSDARLTRLTADTSVAGTPAYIAPEIALGDKDVDARSDLYALGCVAYWLVTGKLPFDRDTPMKMLLAHIHDEPVPPSRVAELPLPDDLEKVILACLTKNPADRPQSAVDLDAQLAACDAAIEDAARWTQERAQQWWRIHHPETLEQHRASPRNDTDSAPDQEPSNKHDVQPPAQGRDDQPTKVIRS